MLRTLLVVTLVACCSLPADAGLRARIRQCKKECGAAIQRCVEQGGRPRKCRRQTLKSCKRKGIAVCALPDTFHVATSGTDVIGCGMPDAPCRTIQFALDGGVPVGGTGTIKVAAGIYADPLVCPTGTTTNHAVVCVLNRQITLLGGFTPPDWDSSSGDPSTTVLDGQNVGRGIRIQHTGPNEAPASLVMEGFAIKNGHAQGASSGTQDQTWTFGGGFLTEDATVTLRHMRFEDNRAVGGNTSDPEGGRGSGGALAINGSTAILEDIHFERNEALGGTGVDMGGFALGGALFSFSSTLTGRQLVLVDNRATAGGSDGVGFVGLEHGDGLGGAIAIETDSLATLENVVVRDNTARGGDVPNGAAGGAYGGGIFVELADLTLRDVVLEHNTARGGDGENDNSPGSVAEGGGLLAIQSNVIVERGVVVDNTARGGDGVGDGGPAAGGGIAMLYTSNPSTGVDNSFTLRNLVIARNTVDVGAGRFPGGGAGGVWIQEAVGVLEHVTIADNRLLNDRLIGAGVNVTTTPGREARATFVNSIIANHTDPAFDPASWANAAVWVGENSEADLTRTLFANNAHDTNAGISGGLNLPPGTVNLAGTVTAADAGFVAPSLADYHITATSPARDQADASAVADDMDGQTRPAGAKADIGADEGIFP